MMRGLRTCQQHNTDPHSVAIVDLCRIYAFEMIKDSMNAESFVAPDRQKA